MASIINLKGLTFPIQLEQKGTGTFRSVYDDNGEYMGEEEILVTTPKVCNCYEVLKSSLNNITMFPIRLRYYNPEFGTAIPVIMKEPNDNVLQALLRTLVINRIIEQEPRVKITNVIYTRGKAQALGIDMNFEVPLDTEI